MEYQKPKIAMAMHDMCGYGRSSLTVVYPLLSALNVQVCPLPTALLSHHFAFRTEPSLLNLGGEIEKFLPRWKEEQFTFDAFFSGYLADPTQTHLAFQLIEEFSPAWIYVDPVLGDEGHLYSGLGDGQIDAMRELMKKAQIISPNLTEACLLLGRPFTDSLSNAEAREMLVALSDFGPQYVAITGVVSDSKEEISIFGLDKKSQVFFTATSPAFPGCFQGTGDGFSSVVLGNLMKGESFVNCVDRAMTYLYKSLKLAVQFGVEICLEPTIPLLISGAQNSRIQFF